MNEWESERERAADEAEQRIGLHRDTLTDALANAQEVIHLTYCVPDGKEWKECTEARAALLAAEEATG